MTSVNFLRSVTKEILTIEEIEAKHTLMFYKKI